MSDKSFEVKATYIKDLVLGNRIWDTGGDRYMIGSEVFVEDRGWDLVIACVHKEYNIWSLTLLKHSEALVTVGCDQHNLRYVDTDVSFTIVESKYEPLTV